VSAGPDGRLDTLGLDMPGQACCRPAPAGPAGFSLPWPIVPATDPSPRSCANRRWPSDTVEPAEAITVREWLVFTIDSEGPGLSNFCNWVG